MVNFNNSILLPPVPVQLPQLPLLILFRKHFWDQNSWVKLIFYHFPFCFIHVCFQTSKFVELCCNENFSKLSQVWCTVHIISVKFSTILNICIQSCWSSVKLFLHVVFKTCSWTRITPDLPTWRHFCSTTTFMTKMPF